MPLTGALLHSVAQLHLSTKVPPKPYTVSSLCKICKRFGYLRQVLQSTERVHWGERKLFHLDSNHLGFTRAVSSLSKICKMVGYDRVL